MYDAEMIRPIELLLVEDDPGDVDLTLEILDFSKLKLNVTVIVDGEQAIQYLKKTKDDKESRTPDLILLDLNMPKKSGNEVLEEIKLDEKLKHIPVVILTTSVAEDDISRSYTSGASCYVTKPSGLKQFQRVISSIENFWFESVKFPPQKS